MSDDALAHAPFFLEERLEEALERAHAATQGRGDLCLALDAALPELARGDGEGLRRAVSEAAAAREASSPLLVRAHREPAAHGFAVTIEVGASPPLRFPLDEIDAEPRAIPVELAQKRALVLGSVCREMLAERLRRLGMDAIPLEAGQRWTSPAPDVVVLDVCSQHTEALRTERAARERFALGELPLVIASDVEVSLDPGQLRTMSISRPVRRSRLVSALRTVLAAPTEVATSASTDDQVKTLVVDDQPLNRAVIAGLLRRLGQRHVDTANHGLDALEACRTCAYDLVLMDLQMPALSGLEAAAQILESTPSRPRIVALTASTFEHDRHACQRVGMRGFLEKPVTETQLRDQLERTRDAMRRGSRRSR